jgi:hypothetical protein
VYREVPDLAKAREKLIEGGQPGGFAFTLDVTNIPEEVKLAELLKENLKAAWIEMRIARMESGAKLARRRSGEFDAATGARARPPDRRAIPALALAPAAGRLLSFKRRQGQERFARPCPVSGAWANCRCEPSPVTHSANNAVPRTPVFSTYAALRQ